MRRGSRGGLFAGLVLLALACPVSMAAQALEVGEARGIRAVWRDHEFSFAFTPAAAPLYKQLAGKVVRVDCSLDLRYPYRYAGGESVWFRAPRRGRRIEPHFRSRRPDRWDYCRIWRASYRVTTRRWIEYHQAKWIVSIPLTQRGAVYLDEKRKAILLRELVEPGGRERGETNPFPSAEVMEGLTIRGKRVVALTGPDATPIKGTIGYWSDGGHHAAAVIVSADGRRLFYEVDTDDVVRTNVAYYLRGRYHPGGA